ncbi:unnamed protein product, partial [Phaeothamnion confervicola]
MYDGLALTLCICCASAFVPAVTVGRAKPPHLSPRMTSDAAPSNAALPEISFQRIDQQVFLGRRAFGTALASTVLISSSAAFADRMPDEAEESQLEDIPALRGLGYGKPRARYPDFILTSSGLQYRDIRKGTGEVPAPGDRVVIDWEGYTIGYYGRPFEAKNRVKGGAFENDKDFVRFIVGKGVVIPAIDETVLTMAPGAIRQLIVPPELGYPPSDPRHDRVGPKPTTFSGERALDFVLENAGFIDKTLLINLEVKRVDRP